MGSGPDPQGGAAGSWGLVWKRWGWARACFEGWVNHPSPLPPASLQKYQNEFNTNVAMAEIYKYAKRYRTQVSTPAGLGSWCPPPPRLSALPTCTLLRKTQGKFPAQVFTSQDICALGVGCQQ